MPTRLPSVLVRYFWPDSLSIRYRAPPPNTSQNVPTNSATARLIKDIFLSCGLISNRFLNVQRFFHRRIRQTEPLLQNTPRHPPFLSSGKTCLRVRLREKSSAP